MLTVLIIFIVLSAVEIPIVDLIVHRWPVVRVAFLIRVCQGLETDLAFSWDDIASVARNTRVDEPKSPRFEETDASRILVDRMQDETDIEIELERPAVVRLPGGGAKSGRQTITGLRIWVDDPRAFVDEVRTYL